MLDIINSLLDLFAFFGENIVKVIKENISNTNLLLLAGIVILCTICYKKCRR